MRPELHSTAPNSGARLAAAAVIVVWLALLAGMLGRYAWPLDLFAQFRLQYALLFAACAIALLIFRRKQLALLALAGLVVSAAPIVAYVGVPTRAAEADSSSEDFRLVSFNVFFRNHDYARIADYLESAHADAIVVQELSSAQAVAQLQALLPSYPHSYVEPSRHDVAIFSRWPMRESESIALSPDGARAAHVVIDWRNEAVAVLGVHLHWPLGGRNSELRNEELAGLAAFARAQQGALLVAGDFNATPWSAHFQDALRDSGLSDSALGQGIESSWPALPVPGLRIDHCLTSKDWRAIDVSTGPYLGSDHRPLIANLQLQR